MYSQMNCLIENEYIRELSWNFSIRNLINHQKFRTLKSKYFIEGCANIHYYFDIRGLQGYPLCAIVFWYFLKWFSKEIDHLSLVDFFALQNFSKKNTTMYELPHNWKRIHKGTFPPQKKNTYVFPNELPNWKRIHKGTFPPKKNNLCIPTWIA